MKPMTSLPWIAGMTISGFTAGNYTEGVDEDRGQGAGSPGAGDVILSAGDGGFGDVQEPDGIADRPECNKTEEASPPEDGGATELNQVTCAKQYWGAECMVFCAEAGAACPPAMTHPFAPSAGRGKLWKCCGCKGDRQCKYIYDNGDECTLRLDAKPDKNWLCKYQGGGQENERWTTSWRG